MDAPMPRSRMPSPLKGSALAGVVLSSGRERRRRNQSLGLGMRYTGEGLPRSRPTFRRKTAKLRLRRGLTMSRGKGCRAAQNASCAKARRAFSLRSQAPPADAASEKVQRQVDEQIAQDRGLDQQDRLALLARHQAPAGAARLFEAGRGAGADALAATILDVIRQARKPPIDPQGVLEVGIKAPRHGDHPDDREHEEGTGEGESHRYRLTREPRHAWKWRGSNWVAP